MGDTGGAETGGRGGNQSDERFLLDAMLGKLVTYLRMCGYDAAYALDRGIEDDDRILDLSGEEGRTLLTRDQQLAERTPDALLLTDRAVTDQLQELANAGIELSIADPPVRCGSCNGLLERVSHAGRQGAGEHVDDEQTPEHVPDDEAVWRCRDCGQWFWRGSHWEDVEATVDY